ncbi:dTDP-4-dehydrorhamnose 3,5-epimerase [Hanstruepera flava]|uniref:dTDP-4-dehydrorhamnose 3,5-epimerase n=1 Tax=Hanstruepera flava TaxID=2930218 RepID=UPI002027709B|nr:dTDP-4-dehydrorhamnose 3,5-epimerase [Hanstruepera flava]
MNVLETKLKDCFIIEPKVHEDKRGYFFETFNLKTFHDKIGFNVNFVQDNETYSSKGVLRGLHFQKGKYAQAKLVRVIKGSVLDVAVDLRPNSPTFGQYETVELSGENKKQFFVPRGFAHGFVVLSETALFAYKCDNFYNKESEGGIIYNDTSLNINWQLPEDQLLLSEKDKVLPSLESFLNE